MDPSTKTMYSRRPNADIARATFAHPRFRTIHWLAQWCKRWWRPCLDLRIIQDCLSDCLMNLLHSTFFTLRATLLQESKSSKWSARASAKTFKHLQVQDHPHVCHSPETYRATNVLHLNTWTAWFMQLCPLWCHVLIRPRLVNAFLDRFKIPMAKKEMHIRHCSLPASQYKKHILKVWMERNIFFQGSDFELEVGRECMSTQLDRGAVLCGPSGAVAFPHQILGIWMLFWKKAFAKFRFFQFLHFQTPNVSPFIWSPMPSPGDRSIDVRNEECAECRWAQKALPQATVIKIYGSKWPWREGNSRWCLVAVGKSYKRNGNLFWSRSPFSQRMLYRLPADPLVLKAYTERALVHLLVFGYNFSSRKLQISNQHQPTIMIHASVVCFAWNILWTCIIFDEIWWIDSNCMDPVSWYNLHLQDGWP